MRVRKRTPSGKLKFHDRQEKAKLLTCANCKSQLHGIPRLIPSDIGRLSLSEKKPNRPYGGYLCAKCSREIFREKARNI